MIAPNVFVAFIYACSALGFIYYGGRLYQMLKRFPVESKGRQNKINKEYVVKNKAPESVPTPGTKPLGV